MKEIRRKQMAQFIAVRQSATMEELCSKFNVSINTVRTDVAYLVSTGAVEKVYGGVRIVQHRQVPLFTQRAAMHTQLKRRIAQQAVQLIQPHDRIFIDAGTTAMHLIDLLPPDKEITVVTDSLYVISRAAEKPGVELLVLPGRLNRRTNAVADGGTLEYLSRYQFSKAFMGASGISVDGKLNVSGYMEYEIKKRALEQSQEAFVLADGSKFGQAGLMSYGTLAQMRALITERQVPEEIEQYCREHQVQLLHVD